MVRDNYLYSSEYRVIDDFVPLPKSIYFYGYSTEGRSHSVDDLIEKYKGDVQFIQIQEIDKDVIIDIESKLDCNLRNTENVKEFLRSYMSDIIYFDVTGLNNRVSASLLKAALNQPSDLNFKEIRIIYSEPETYKIERFKAEGIFNDLSEQISGIEPLPGFATIIPDDYGSSVFVVLLGFEGGRFTHIIENTQPQGDTIIPIIGVPGFRIEYPYVAYWGNRRPIKETDSWRRLKFVAANSIVDIYLFLSNLENKYPTKKIKVAPIGTKPHAIGAILFAIKYFDKVELIYDNPIRKKRRTVGVGKIVECNALKLVKEK